MQRTVKANIRKKAVTRVKAKIAFIFNIIRILAGYTKLEMSKSLEDNISKGHNRCEDKWMIKILKALYTPWLPHFQISRNNLKIFQVAKWGIKVHTKINFEDDCKKKFLCRLRHFWKLNKLMNFCSIKSCCFSAVIRSIINLIKSWKLEMLFVGFGSLLKSVGNSTFQNAKLNGLEDFSIKMSAMLFFLW